MPDARTDALTFRKSSLSYANGGCIEVAAGSGEDVYVRDSKNPGGRILTFSSKNWNAFADAICSGKFDFR